MIQVESLVKVYRDVTAVDGLTFGVAAGEVLGLVGPNGAGKTTTLRCMAGILPPTSGRLRIAGFDLETEAIEAKRRLAFMPDEPRLFEYLTVADHLALSGRLYQVAVAAEKTRALLDELELSGRERALPLGAVARHEAEARHRLRALHEPQVLIFDEPLTGIDPIGIRRMKQTILARAKAGAAVIVSSHLLHLVEEICGRVLILHRGRSVLLGTLDEVRAAAGGGSVSLEDVFCRITSEATEPTSTPPE